ncbi:MAG: hypothetical protein ABSB76_04605 [Streptosporangiaceae bacterium]
MGAAPYTFFCARCSTHTPGRFRTTSELAGELEAGPASWRADQRAGGRTSELAGSPGCRGGTSQAPDAGHRRRGAGVSSPV